MYDFAGEKIVEQTGELLDPKADWKPVPHGEEAAGVQRVVEALECVMWKNMVKLPQGAATVPPAQVQINAKTEKAPVVKSEEEEKKTTKAPSEPNPEAKEHAAEPKEEKAGPGCEEEIDAFESLMSDMMHVKEKYVTDLTRST